MINIYNINEKEIVSDGFIFNSISNFVKNNKSLRDNVMNKLQNLNEKNKSKISELSELVKKTKEENMNIIEKNNRKKNEIRLEIINLSKQLSS